MRPTGSTRIRSSRREIAVAVADSLGNTARDKVVLEAARGDRGDRREPRAARCVGSGQGRALRQRTLGRAGFPGSRRRRAAGARPRQQGGHAGHFRAARSTAARACRAGSTSSARRPAGSPASCAPRDRMLVVPFSKTLEPITGPTDDRATVSDAIGRISPAGGTAILDCLIRTGAASRQARGAPGGRPDHRRLRRAQREPLRGRRSRRSKPCRRPSTSSASAASPASRSKASGSFARLQRRPAGARFCPAGRKISPRCTTRSPLTCRIATCCRTRRRIRNRTARGARSRSTTGDPSYTVRARSGYFAPKPPPVRAVDRVHDHRRRAPVRRRRRERPRRRREWRRADGRDVPRSGHAGVDRPGARCERQHEEMGRDRESGCASFVDALRPQDPLGVLLFADGAELAHDLGTDRASRPRRDRWVRGERRHCALRRSRRFARTVEESRRAPGDRGRHRWP